MSCGRQFAVNINRLAVLEQADDIEDANASAFDYCVAAPNAGQPEPHHSTHEIALAWCFDES